MASVLVIDFGSQYSHLIVRRVHTLGVDAELIDWRDLPAAPPADMPRGVILSGSSEFSSNDGAPTLQEWVHTIGIPVLGICYGAQLIARDLGGYVGAEGKREYGKTDLRETDNYSNSLILDETIRDKPVWMSHRDSVEKEPPGFRVTATSTTGQIAVFEDHHNRRFGVMFHPEVFHSQGGNEILRRFLLDVCECELAPRSLWDIDAKVSEIRRAVGSDRVVCALSGGVDSAVTAALLERAIPQQVTYVFVDTGLMRLGEKDDVCSAFRAWHGSDILPVNSGDSFFNRLAGISDPEAKRRAIGEQFVREFERIADQVGASFLAQGTIYPDIVESGRAGGSVIKSHHNVGGLPADMSLAILEPLRDLYKDQVREMGGHLGIPPEILWRHPFPGPGLAISVIGKVSRRKVDIVRKADSILLEELLAADLYKYLWQAFTVLLPLRTVGVMGDRRTYEYPLVIRAVSSMDAMTADWFYFSREVLDKLSHRLVREVDGVNRVAVDITSKPPATIDWA
jgi:GMP synthase (glutamine-hydrolysing)